VSALPMFPKPTWLRAAAGLHVVFDILLQAEAAVERS